MQQGCDSLNVGIGHAPALCHTTQQHVGQRHDAHALVVCHEGHHRGKHLGAGAPGRGEVERFNEAVALTRSQRRQSLKIARGQMWRNLCGQRSGIRGNHQLVRRRSAQREPGHALRRILIRQRVVPPGIGRLRDAPRHVLAQGIRYLFLQGGVARAAQNAAMGLDKHQAWHQVLKHGA